MEKMTQLLIRRAIVGSGLVGFLVGCMAAPRPARTVERPAAEEEQIARVPATRLPPPPTRAAPARASLTVHAVSVRPAQVARGQQADLIVSYSLSGLGQGTDVTVTEHRELLKEGMSILEVEDTFSRSAGAHSSAKPVQVPAAATPGIYTLEIKLVTAGAQAEGSAIFEVR